MIYLLTFEEFSRTFMKWWVYIRPYVIDFLIIIAILFLTKKLTKPILDGIRTACSKAHIDRGVTSFFCSVTHFLIIVLSLLVILSVVGVSSATIATAVASGSLAVGLALQGTLQNFAGGVLILLTKPFIAGDYIKVGNYEGTVISIDICYTKLQTYDNQIVVLPNGQLSNSNLVNVFREKYRRMDIKLPISYEDDIRAVRVAVLQMLSENELIINEKPKEVIVNEFGDSSVNLIVRVWCKADDYWPVRNSLAESIKYIIDEKGFTIPFNQVDITIKNEQN